MHGALLVLFAACGGDGSTELDDSGAVRPIETAECVPLAASMRSDFSPGADDDWPACVADSGQYEPIEATISTRARVDAFERIAVLLFDPATPADPAAFINARGIYQEDEGLDSRVVRRYDPHFPVEGEVDCGEAATVVREPEYCVGPAHLQPLIIDALNAGAAGDDPSGHAARVEAGLVWFLYVSAYKESLSCTEKAKDCDSSYAYYTGGEAPARWKGLSRLVEEVSPEANRAAYEGALAVRCWRDLDPDTPATDRFQRDLARTQYDRAALRGVILVMADRLATLRGVEGSVASYQRSFLGALLPLLEVRAASSAPAMLETLQALADASDWGAEQLDSLQAALDMLADCDGVSSET